MSWADGRLTACDLETTCAEPEEARIVTASVALVGGGEPVVAHDWLADPGVEIPDEAAAIHGVATEHAREFGQSSYVVTRDVLNVLERRPAGSPVVIMNARFDLTVLDREARRHGLVPLQDRGPLHVVDPLVIDKWLDRYRRGSRKLDALCEHYRVRLDREDTHGAAVDALAAARLAWRLGHEGEVIRRVRSAQDAVELKKLRARWALARCDLPALHALQVEVAAEQAAGLEDYFRRGNPAKDLAPDPDAHVARAWPIVPAQETVT